VFSLVIRLPLIACFLYALPTLFDGDCGLPLRAFVVVFAVFSFFSLASQLLILKYAATGSVLDHQVRRPAEPIMSACASCVPAAIETNRAMRLSHCSLVRLLLMLLELALIVYAASTVAWSPSSSCLSPA
jgi:hypothetical protein